MKPFAASRVSMSAIAVVLAGIDRSAPALIILDSCHGKGGIDVRVEQPPRTTLGDGGVLVVVPQPPPIPLPIVPAVMYEEPFMERTTPAQRASQGQGFYRDLPKYKKRRHN